MKDNKTILSSLKAHVDGAILEIITNGCTLPTRMLEIYFSTAVSLAKIEQIMEELQKNKTNPA